MDACAGARDVMKQNVNCISFLIADDEVEATSTPAAVAADVSNERVTSSRRVASAASGHSRLTPDMSRLRTRRTSSAAKRKKTRLRINMAASASTSSSAATTPRSCQTSPSPRSGSALFRVIEPQHPLPTRGASENFQVSPRPRLVTPASTTCSLDVVDLWEESETDNEVDDLSVSSASTCDVMQGLKLAQASVTSSVFRSDVTDVMRSQSPVACKRNKVFVPTQPSSAAGRDKLQARDASRSRLPVRVRSRLRKRASLRRTLTPRQTPPSTPSSPEQPPPPQQTLTSTTDATKPTLFKTKPADVTSIHLPEVHSNNDVTSQQACMAEVEGQATSQGQGRRVKFSSFVRVQQENNASTLEFLKKSNDTARAIKNKYLRMTSARNSGVTSDRLLHTIH